MFNKKTPEEIMEVANKHIGAMEVGYALGFKAGAEWANKEWNKSLKPMRNKND